MSQLSDSQKELVNELLRRISPDDTKPFDGFPQFQRCAGDEGRFILAYKYLKAKAFNIEDAFKMACSTNEFRKSHKLDSLLLFPSLIPLRGFVEDDVCTALQLPRSNLTILPNTRETTYTDLHDFLKPIIDCISRHYPSSIHNRDKIGHPVMYGCLGKLDSKALYRDLQKLVSVCQSPEMLAVFFHLYGNELLIKLVQYCDTLEENARRITTATVILDCKGLYLFDFIRQPMRDIIKKIMSLDKNYYPEVLHSLILVNCPPSVMFTNAVLKLFGRSDKNLRQKIVCVGSDKTLSYLQTIIDDDKIPHFLGGKCQCDGDCVPLQFSTENETSSNRSTRNSPSVCLHTDSFASESNGHVMSSKDDELEDSEESGESGILFTTPETTKVEIPPRRKHMISFEVNRHEEVTWEFSVLRGSVHFTAVFVECTADGRTTVLTPNTNVREAANHFLPTVPGEVILTWDNSKSFFKRRRLRLRVHHRQNSTSQSSLPLQEVSYKGWPNKLVQEM